MAETPTGAISVSATPVQNKPGSLPQSVLDLRVLVNGSGNSVPPFLQFNYKNVYLPVQADPSNPTRNIDGDGCSLCCWSSLLAAAGCKVPVLDPTTKKFSLPSGAAAIDPPTLLKYFIDYATSQTSTPAEAKSWGQTNLFGPVGAGTVIHGSPAVRDAVNNLVGLSHPGTTPQFDNTINTLASEVGGDTGKDLSQVDAALQAGNPVIMVPCFTGSPCTAGGNHHVLAVGIAKIGKSTFYVISNPGHNIYDPLPALQSGGHATLATLNDCIACKDRTTVPYPKIFRYRVLGGLKPYTNFELKPVFT